MDAKITKDRLSNLLSYDWLKIVAAILGAVCLLSVLFTTMRTRPRDNQIFAVYAYTDLQRGLEESRVGEDMLEKGVFSYDILKTQAESFNGNMYSGMAFNARRAAGEGTVMFISDVRKPAEEGKEPVKSALQTLAGDMIEKDASGNERMGLFLDPQKFFSDCEAYLQRFFGENWQTGALDEGEAEACFLARNGRDKRYKNEESIKKGIEDEKARLIKLRDDLIAVTAMFESGKFNFVSVKGENKEHVCAVNVGKLGGLSNVYYYTEEENGTTVRKTDAVCLTIFDNGDRQGDLKYETVSFFRYLGEHFNG